MRSWCKTITHPLLRSLATDQVRMRLVGHFCWFGLQCFDADGRAAGRASGLRKTEWRGAGVVICLELCADLHTVQLMPLPLTVSCFNKIQTGFTFLVAAYPGSPGQRAIKRVCVSPVGVSALSFFKTHYDSRQGTLYTRT